VCCVPLLERDEDLPSTATPHPAVEGLLASPWHPTSSDLGVGVFRPHNMGPVGAEDIVFFCHRVAICTPNSMDHDFPVCRRDISARMSSTLNELYS